MIVSKKNLRTPDEEMEHLWALFASNGNYFVWDVTPTVVKTREITDQRLLRKIKALAASDEWKDSNP